MKSRHSKKHKFYSKKSGKMETYTCKDLKLTTAELAKLLASKRMSEKSLTCQCGREKTQGFEFCRPCTFSGKSKKNSWGEKNQASQKKKFGPNRKNRKKSKVIDLILSRDASLPLSSLSKPNELQYSMNVKTILRSKSQLQELADQLTPLERLQDF